MTDSGIFQVALPVPRGEVYDYLSDQDLTPGQRVKVSFGQRQLVGMVVGRRADSDISRAKLKAISQIIDPEPLVEPAWLELLNFTARYYQAPLGMAIATALPGTLRKGKLARISRQILWRLSAAGREQDPMELHRAPQQQAGLRALQNLPPGDYAASQIGPQGSKSTILKALAGKGLVQAIEDDFQTRCADLPQLNGEQQQAVDAIAAQSGFHCHVLDGVTGSGKTEVYLALARRLISENRQCLILVPEIGLTPQMIQRVAEGTGARVVALHSGLADGQRHNAWLAARDGEADIILGTRSAIFTPLARPGMIIVDEEHDASYKQQDGLRYHARDLAVWRGRQLKIPVLLGSATPSLESRYNVIMGRYQSQHLDQRHGQARPPRLSIVDLRGETCPDGLSPRLIQATRQHLDAGNQVLLFINRRGFSPILICHDCGWTAMCPRCDARLISHRRSASLRCHHCGHQRPLPDQCPDCHSQAIQHLGQGTERVEQATARLWPGIPRLRLDRDILQRRGELEAALQQIASGEVRLIIGTQMLAKGHDFPNLSLVGIIDADQGLYGQDFRASEHLAQLVTQVAGRAGRRETPGEVLLQTHNPDHLLLRSLDPGRYQQVSESLLGERQMLNWPPFSRLALLRAEGRDIQAIETALHDLAESFYGIEGLDVLGPVPAIMERKAGQHRYQLLLRSNQRALLQQQLAQLRQRLEQAREFRRLRWSIDVDPLFLD